MSAEYPVDTPSIKTEPVTEGIKIPEIEPALSASKKKSKKTKIPFCLFLYTLFVLIPLIAMGYFVYQNDEIIKNLKTKLLQEQLITQDENKSLKNTFADYQLKNTASNQTIQEQLAAQALQLHQLTDKHNWRISEAIYLVAIAQERLNMMHDVPTAIKLLQTAEDRLKNVGDSRTSRVRESIANDIHLLETKGRFDQIGLWVELGVLRKQVENLSFHTLQGSIEGQPDIVGATEPAYVERAPWRQALDHAWQELKGLIKVREFNADKLNSSLEPRDQILLLRALDLTLIEAQWSVLQEQPLVYQQSLERLEDKLNIYFVHDELWQKVNAELKVLKTKAVQPLNIDLSNTLSLLKTLDSVSSSSKIEKAS